ncbi:MAG: FAD-dependent oxidoreductase [Syntrophales bacterium]|jgi:2,4-dienoyl-CoA reductase (NADPH2)|nr:FAD-dependent oxidoreductase [Syntrophales bacterium]MCK9528176.1 FAD-dependent oxidoreductase [Syntrophales bacterium]MDX9921146.1 FAD-dependent oxidoreductase [Syntrophales bacterium]
MFEHLFTPIHIGTLEVPNRIVMLPLTTAYGEDDGTLGDRFIDFYAERARGGAGLIIVPFAPLADGSPVEPGLYDDRFLPGVRRLTESIAAGGARSSCQLISSYHLILRDNTSEAVGPSEVYNRLLRVTPRALTIDEIRFIVSGYGAAALRARRGGFDAVEVLAGGGYLLNRFLSPLGNTRDDEYGGSLENRTRILLEIIGGIRRAVGRDFPVGVRLNVHEQMEGGYGIDEGITIARMLEEAGVNMLTFYTGWHESPIPTVAPSLPEGAFAHLAGALRNSVTIPVIAANRISNLTTAEKIIAAGQADLAGMARALLADPELPNKGKSGRSGEINPCILCSRCLGEVLSAYRAWGRKSPVFCTVNPRAGRESSTLIEHAGRAKKVCVIGGGPAGLTAARTAAERGHSVTLFEKEEETGGWLRVGCLPPHKEHIRLLSESLALRARLAGVDIRVGTEADRRTVAAQQPEALILAAGARPVVPPIPGIDAPQVVPAEEVLTGKEIPRGTVIVIGGGLVGCETAELLLARKGDVTGVTVVEMLDTMAPQVSATYRPFFLARLKAMGVRMETGTTVEAITDRGVRVKRRGEVGMIEGDCVVLAVGLKADSTLPDSFGHAGELYAVGDCVDPRMIREAVEEGFDAAMRI